jgi:CubicO group peptidase (beta-lactamase class C family)
VKGLRSVLILLLVAVLAIAAVLARDALQVGIGYSAKQLCSGVFVAGLPADFVRERDIQPRMAILGPARQWLQTRVAVDDGYAEAEFLGARVRAVHRVGTGCTLHATGAGAGPLPPAVVSEPAPATPPELRSIVDAAFAEPPGGGRNTLALLLSVDGELLVERYLQPVTAANRLQGWSMNKSLVATWIELARQRRLIDPQATVRELLAGLDLAGEVDRRMTLAHLTQMESGLKFLEMYGPGSDVTRMLYRTDAMWRVPASRSQAHAPGSHFAYSSGDTVLAAFLWQRALGEPYDDWLQREFRAPLGVHSLVAEADASGAQVGSSYAYMSARDWWRVGQLWLDAWHGRSALLPQAWIRESTAPRDSDPHGRYGRGFWLNTGGMAFEGAPESLFYAGGNAGQYVVVIPEWELVLVRLGLSGPFANTGVGDFLGALPAALAERRSRVAP